MALAGALRVACDAPVQVAETDTTGSVGKDRESVGDGGQHLGRRYLGASGGFRVRPEDIGAARNGIGVLITLLQSATYVPSGDLSNRSDDTSKGFTERVDIAGSAHPQGRRHDALISAMPHGSGCGR